MKSVILSPTPQELEYSANQENFPVFFWLAPAALRQDLALIYRFARMADNLADCPHQEPQKALNELKLWQKSLVTRSLQTPLWSQLYDCIDRYRLPVQEFSFLLEAFIKDREGSYESKDFHDTLKYCRYSAVPIGRILLALCPLPGKQPSQKIDRLCIGLQLLNFYQDIAYDWQTLRRRYIQQDDLEDSGLCFNDLFSHSLSWVCLKPRLMRRLTIYLSPHDLECYQQWPLFSYTLATYHYALRAQKKLSSSDSIFQCSKLKWYDLARTCGTFVYDEARLLFRYPLSVGV